VVRAGQAAPIGITTAMHDDTIGQITFMVDG